MALTRLADIPIETLEAIHSHLLTIAPPAIVKSPEELGTELGRYDIAVRVGCYQVTEEFARAIAVRKREAEGKS